MRGRLRTLPPVCALVLSAALSPDARASITIDDVQVREGNAPLTATFTIRRAAPALAPAVTVSFATVSGGAVAGADFAPVAGTRSFAGTLFAATQTQQVAVTVAGDALDEDDERFVLAIGGPEVRDAQGSATIVDDDPPPALSVADAPAVGERGGPAPFVLTLSAVSGRDVSVAFATGGGSATAGSDYAARGGRIAIAAGATTATIGVPVIDDALDEPAETFGIGLSAPAGASLARGQALATIVDDDEPPAAPPAGGPPAGGGGPAGARPPATGSSPATGGDGRPRLGLSSPRLQRPSSVLVTVACPIDAARCSGRMTIFSRPNRRSKITALRSERRLGRARFALAAGASRTLRLRLAPRDHDLLYRAGRIRVRVYAVTQDGSGRTGVRTSTGTLVARSAHSR